MPEKRDLWRALGALAVVYILDAALFLTLGLPRDTDAELLVFALGYVLLCAIREPRTADPLP